MLEYEITAVSNSGGDARVSANKSFIPFDATSGRHDQLPNPAELLLSSLAACMLKNVQRYSEMLNMPYRKARVRIKGTRTDNPPSMAKIEYVLEIDTDVDDRKLETWHKNILKFGTITNTLMRSCHLTGKISKWNSTP
ncbi:MAG: OsmC family protein [Tenuifilum sp.]|uniref:OsmC family protein n=1 Tax=Tenuifilum sp. TaxID=2760880 RepID=UPI00309B6A9E